MINRKETNRTVFNWVSKVITQLLWFCIAMVCDWLKHLTPLSQPIRSKTKTNRDLLARVFPRLVRATCICFELWLVHWTVYDCCDWSEKLLWFWFYDTQMKTALKDFEFQAKINSKNLRSKFVPRLNILGANSLTSVAFCTFATANFKPCP